MKKPNFTLPAKLFASFWVSVFLLPTGTFAASSQLEHDVQILKQQAKRQQHEIVQLDRKIHSLKHKGKAHSCGHAQPPGALNTCNTSGLRSAHTVDEVCNPTKYDWEYPKVSTHDASNSSESCHGYFPMGTANYLRNNYPLFYSVVAQNGARSYARRNFCIRDTFCFSGLMNLDLKYYDRMGSGGDALPGQGIRPVFGTESKQVLGSINNADLFIDAGLNDWVGAHFDFAYVNGSHKLRTHAVNNKDWGSVYRLEAALKVNEAYMVFANPAILPLYIKIGRFYQDFGDYQPFPMTESLTQLLSEARTGGIQLGAVFSSGFYGSVYWTSAQQSIENLNDLTFIIPGREANGDGKDRNYGGKIGFRGVVHDVKVNVNASYTADIRDADYISSQYDLANTQFAEGPDVLEFYTRNAFLVTQRAEGLALHGDIKYSRFGLRADYVSALREINPPAVATGKSKICAVDLVGSVNFCIGSHTAQLDLGYSQAWNTLTARFEIIPVFPPLLAPGPAGPVPLFFPLFPPSAVDGPTLPQCRYMATFSMLVMPNVNLAAQWINDHEFGPEEGGNGRVGNIGLVRLSFDI